MFGSATVDVEGFKVIGSVIGRGEIEGGNGGMLHRDKKNTLFIVRMKQGVYYDDFLGETMA